VRSAFIAVKSGMLKMRAYLPIALVALAQFGASRPGLLVSNFGGESTPLWPASGIAVASTLLVGKGAWLGIAVGSCAATLMNGVNLLASAGVGIGRGLGALAGAALIRRFVRSAKAPCSLSGALGASFWRRCWLRSSAIAWLWEAWVWRGASRGREWRRFG
jgi:hypothetical protein